MTVAEELRAAVRTAAAVGDAHAFRKLALKVGGLERAQEIVRAGERTRPSGMTINLVEKHRGTPPLIGSSRRNAAGSAPSAGSGAVRAVVLSRRAHETMSGLVDSDGCEHGGFLVGERVGDELRVVDVSDGGSDERGANFVRLDWSAGLRLVEDWRARGFDLCVSGCWHTHQDGSDARPSEGDLKGLADRLSRSGDWVELIGASATSWAPAIHWRAYRAFRGESGRAVCAPATLKIEEGY